MSKILLIDDKMDNLVTLSALLKNLMPVCAVVTAQSGTEGIEKAKAGVPDVILLDVKMPEMDGFETCRRLKSDESTKHIPVIMITAIKTDPQSRIKGLEIGADAFLAKPIDQYELVSQVKVALRIKKAEDTLREERDSLERLAEERTMAIKEGEESARDFLESVINAIADPVFVKDDKRRFVLVNEALCAIVGRPREALLGEDGDDMFPEEEVAVFREMDAVVLDTGEENVNEEILSNLSTGEVRTIVTRKTRYIDPNGNHFLVGVIRDITERKQAEDALQESEKNLRDTLNATPFPTAVVDLQDDKIYFWSHSAITLFGHTAPTASEWYQLAYPDPIYRQEVIDRWKPFLEKARESGLPVNTGECRVTCRDGSERICELYATFLPDNLIVTFNDITGRKLAEEDLSQIFTMSLDMISIADINTATFIKVNPAFTEILGYSEKELLEKPFLDFVHPDDLDATLAVIKKNLKSGAKVINFENRYRCNDGSYRWLSWVGHPKPELGVTYSVARDITEGKQNEEALKKNKALLDATARIAKVGGWELDLQTQRVLWTQMTGMIHELPEDFVPSLEEAITYYHPDDQKMVADYVNRAVEEGTSYEFEARLITAKGQQKWVRAIGEATMERGKCVRLSGIFQDITEHKEAEISLRESEEQFRHFFEHLTIGVAVYEAVEDGKDFLLIDMNSAGQQLSKVSIDKIRGERLTKVFPGVRDLGLFEALQNTWRTGQPANIPLSQYKDENITQWVENRIFRLPSKKVVAIYDDRTEIMYLEQRLSQAQKMESIGNLAGGIAHDFNNILSSVIGFTELALDEAPEGTVLEDSLQEVYSAGKRAKDLVKQILAFARKSDEKRSPIQPAGIAKEVMKFLRSTIPTTIKIKQNIESNSLIMGNATQVHQVLMNLCTNAAHAMEDIGGTLELSLKDIVVGSDGATQKKGKTPGDYVEIVVSDTGVGIPSDIIDKIYEPYFTTKGPGEGTGIGLALVHGVIAGYGGSISVDSTVGKGTAFTIRLPTIRKRPFVSPHEIEELPYGIERVLFVDDELPIAKMSAQILERLGYSVETRTDGVEALELFKSRPNDFDLVITDTTMPKMTGDKLAIELMKIRRDIPVILFTGYSKKISDDMASQIGIRAFAYKPIVKADLAREQSGEFWMNPRAQVLINYPKCVFQCTEFV